MIFSRSGSGTYNLRMNSYKCCGNTPIIVASSPFIAASTETGVTPVISASNNDTAESASVSAPTAEYVPASSQYIHFLQSPYHVFIGGLRIIP